MTDKDLVLYTLGGLGRDSIPSFTSLTSRDTLVVSFATQKGMLLSYEHKLMQEENENE